MTTADPARTALAMAATAMTCALLGACSSDDDSEDLAGASADDVLTGETGEVGEVVDIVAGDVVVTGGGSIAIGGSESASAGGATQTVGADGAVVRFEDCRVVDNPADLPVIELGDRPGRTPARRSGPGDGCSFYRRGRGAHRTPGRS